jgi:RNA polymerase sigma-70 factor, ECF subfamily
MHDRDDRGRDRRAGGAVTTDQAEESAFAALSEQHRRELHVHCYRMLAS